MFRKNRSINQYDGQVVVASTDRADTRHLIRSDVSKRCNEIMRYFRAECAYWRPRGIKDLQTACITKTSKIFHYMQGVDPSYSRVDITYALCKLEREGFLKKHGAYYSLRHDPREVTITFR
jgi:phenylalanyl-tRNA synthetase beta subunit